MKGRVRIRQKQKNGKFGKWTKWNNNLFLDDGKELTLDFLFGRNSWWNPKTEPSDYVGGDSGWNTNRYVGVGICMFNNKSLERASGFEGIPSGSEYDYKISDHLLVNPEDSYLSNPVGSRILLDAIRRDQVIEFTAHFDAPGDIPTGTQIRELGIFLSSSGPTHDPSYHNGSKPNTILCRSVVYGTGFYNASGATGAAGNPGFVACYKDDPFVVVDDIELQWEFGDL